MAVGHGAFDEARLHREQTLIDAGIEARAAKEERQSRLIEASLAPQTDDGPKFVLHPILPRRVVTLLGAHGGAGKSGLALQIAAHVAAGEGWAGLRVESPQLAVFVTLEDEAGLVRHRLSRIVRHFLLDESAVHRNLRLLDGTSMTTGLVFEAAFDGMRTIQRAPEFDDLEEACSGAGLIVIDNASDAFDANENERSMVRRFVRGHLGGIARANDAAVLLLAHVDKASARFGSNGNTYSGSTAWHNSARSRLALAEKDGALELVHEKSNVSRRAETIRLEFTEEGVLAPAPKSLTSGDEQGSEERLLLCLSATVQAGETVYTATAGTASSFSILRRAPGFPSELRKADDFFAAMRSLERSGRIVRESFRTHDRKVKERWIAPNAPNAPNRDNGALDASGEDWRAECAKSPRRGIIRRMGRTGVSHEPLRGCMARGVDRLLEDCPRLPAPCRTASP